MPEFKPDVWNQTDVVKINNCYNYAANDLRLPSLPERENALAEPGTTHDITAARVVAAESGGDNYTLYLDYTCEGIRTASIVDELHETNEDGDCEEGCWRVACFVRHFAEGPPAISGTPHFVREDSPGAWSHKPGALPATQHQYNPAKKDYSGPFITDPSKDNVGPGLEFCGYLCCHPATKVAGLQY